MLEAKAALEHLLSSLHLENIMQIEPNETEPYLPATLVVPAAGDLDFDTCFKEALAAAATLHDVCSQIDKEQAEKYSDDVRHMISCLDLWCKRMSTALMFWCVAEFSRAARTEDSQLELSDMTTKVEKFRVVRAGMEAKVQTIVQKFKDSEGELDTMSDLKLLANFMEVVKKTVPGGPFCNGHTSTPQAVFAFYAQVGSCCSEANCAHLKDIIQKGAEIAERAKVDLTESSSRLDDHRAEGLQICCSMVVGGACLEKKAGELRDLGIQYMEDMWSRRSGNDLPLTLAEVNGLIDPDLSINGVVAAKVSDMNSVEATSAFDQVLGVCETLAKLGKPVADNQETKDQVMICIKAFPVMSNIVAFSKADVAADYSAFIKAAGQVLKDIEANAGPLSSMPHGDVIGERLGLFKAKIVKVISDDVEKINVEFTAACDDMQKYLLPVNSLFKKWDEEEATNSRRFAYPHQPVQK